MVRMIFGCNNLQGDRVARFEPAPDFRTRSTFFCDIKPCGRKMRILPWFPARDGILYVAAILLPPLPETTLHIEAFVPLSDAGAIDYRDRSRRTHPEISQDDPPS